MCLQKVRSMLVYTNEVLIFQKMAGFIQNFVFYLKNESDQWKWLLFDAITHNGFIWFVVDWFMENPCIEEDTQLWHISL